MNPPRRRLHGVVAVLGSCGLLLTACAAGDLHQTPAGAVTTAPATAALTAVPAELARYYGQRPGWRACDAVPSFQCATIKVPLDYDRPQAGDITLAAIRRPATGSGAARVGSLQMNPGGPGSSAITYLLDNAGSFSPAVRAAYDLVAVDPRGVGASTVVDCATDTPASVQDPGARKADIDASAAAYAQVAAECARHAGRLLPHVGTVDAARDMDVVRAVLGDERLHYVGFSYGTYLGATYAGLFPSRVGRMVLDGAVDPALDGYAFTIEQAQGYQTAWKSFAADCATRPDCPVGHSVQEAGRTLNGLVARLDRTPLRQGKDTTVTGDSVLGAVVLGLRAPAWETLRAALAELLAGQTAAVQALLGGDEETDPGDQSYYAVSCLSSTLGTWSTVAQAQAALPEFRRVAPQFGEYYAGTLPMCTRWPVRPNQAPGRITAAGAPPVLVVGTLRDPATPYPWAQALAGQFSSGRLLTWDGDGHTAYHRGSVCIESAVDGYLTRGHLPPAGTVCL
ncbi:alpha/beta hydrolase [Actinacidiphila sp. bgisy167]|uniref:alpha/beta hydrolase n=1 Tax=Actinacidiphila sp. bgisy167 TaxID=3413797 RepID=UPI003D761A9A